MYIGERVWKQITLKYLWNNLIVKTHILINILTRRKLRGSLGHSFSRTDFVYLLKDTVKELHILYSASKELATDCSKCVTAQTKFLWDCGEQLITAGVWRGSCSLHCLGRRKWGEAIPVRKLWLRSSGVVVFQFFAILRKKFTVWEVTKLFSSSIPVFLGNCIMYF